jgi:hypothetical protein
VPAEADQLHRLGGKLLSSLDRVDETQQACRLVVNRNVDGLRVEDISDLVADCVVDRLLVELARDRLLHAVDQRQLGVPLSRLLDRAGARERGADVLPDEGEEILVMLGVSALGCVRLHRQHTDGALLGLQRNAEPAAVRGDNSERHDLIPLDQHLIPLVVAQERLARSEDVRRYAPCLPRADRVPLVRIGEIVVGDLVDVIGPVHELALLVVQGDIEVPRVHELADDLVDRAVELLHVLRGARELRDAVKRVLDLLPVFAPHDFEYRAHTTPRLGWRDD